MRATYDQLTRFCPKGRELRQQFDNETAPGVHPSVTSAYFAHLQECIICRRARARLLREQDRAQGRH